MKKTILAIGLLIAGAFCFAEPFEGGTEIVETFFKKGNYIKYISTYDVHYYNKNVIAHINVDSDEMEIVTTVKVPSWGGRNNVTPEFPTKRFSFESDENGNIIITRKY